MCVLERAQTSQRYSTLSGEVSWWWGGCCGDREKCGSLGLGVEEIGVAINASYHPSQAREPCQHRIWPPELSQVLQGLEYTLLGLS